MTHYIAAVKGRFAHAAATIGQAGLTLIEILIVIAVLALLASLVLNALGHSKDKARDTATRNAVGQLRLLAEEVHGSNNGSYRNWETKAPQDDLDALKAEIDKQFGASGQYVIADTQTTNFCVSAPLRGEVGRHYCVDASGAFTTVSSPCVEVVGAAPKLACAAN